MSRIFHSHKNPIAVLLGMIVFGGIYASMTMQTSLFPEITFPKIKIIADAGQQPIDKMMITVTRQLEHVVKQVPGLKTLRSTTSRGSCEIAAVMDWNTDLDVSQQKIESRINQIRYLLPADIQIMVEKMNPSILPVLGYSLDSPTRSPIELKHIATFTVKPFLSQVDGVAELRVIGGKTKEYWVVLDRKKMSMLGLTPDLIASALSKTNFIQSNGYLSDYHRMYLTLTDASIKDRRQLEQLVIVNNGNRIVRLSDISSVEIREAKEYVKINANGHEGVLLAVIKQPDANLVSLSKDVEEKVKELQRLLPKDVQIHPYYVQADFVNDSVRSVRDSVWIGVGLALLVSILFLRSLKAGATILLTVPATLFLTVIVLDATGQTFNIMTLGAIAAAIGLIIDDAIVVVEQIHRTQEEHPGEDAHSLVAKAIRYLFPAMLSSSLSTIVIFLPFLLMTGVAGAYFKVMTNTMLITLVCSFIVTWIALPVLYLLFKTRDIQILEEEEQMPQSRRWVEYAIHRPWVSASIVLALIVVMLVALPRIETGFLPEMDEGSIVLDYVSPPGTSLEETDRILRQVEKILGTVPEVAVYSRRSGTQMGFFITEPNDGDYLIQLKKERSRSTAEVIDDIRKKVERSQPALRIDFGQVIGDMLGDLMASVQPVEVKIFGSDRKRVQDLSKQIAEVVAGVRGAEDVFDGLIVAGPSITIEPRYPALVQFGISPDNLQYQLRTALEGNVVGAVYEPEQLCAIRMVYPENSWFSTEELRNAQVFLPSGKLKPITQLASIGLSPGDAEVDRENLQNVGRVTARLSERDLGSVMKDIRHAIAAHVHIPQGYYIEYGGAYAEQQQSFNELLLILLSATFLVFAVMLFMFRQFKVALVIMGLSVLGVAGSIAALFITGTPLNVGSYTGMIMMVGIIGENAIFTFWQFHEYLHAHSVDEAIAYAISTRLRPKLMTALGAITALMPLALGLGAGARLHQPLAIAVIGGFVIALPLLLVVLPTMIRLTHGRHQTDSSISPH